MKIRLLFLLAFLFTLQSCDTDDISPAVSITASSTEISEDQGLTTITASLNSESNQEMIIPVTFSGTAIFGEDYISSFHIIKLCPNDIMLLNSILSHRFYFQSSIFLVAPLENLDYKNKKVVVIGSGATAVTIVPR